MLERCGLLQVKGKSRGVFDRMRLVWASLVSVSCKRKAVSGLDSTWIRNLWALERNPFIYVVFVPCLQVSHRSVARKKEKKKHFYLSSVGSFTAFGLMGHGSVSRWNRFFTNKNNSSFAFIFLVTFKNVSLSTSHFAIFFFSGLNTLKYCRFSLWFHFSWHYNSESAVSLASTNPEKMLWCSGILLFFSTKRWICVF